MIKAVEDKIIVEELKRTQSEGGIIFPEGASDPQCYGKVISVGDKVINIKDSDIVVFHQRGGQSVLIGRKLLRVLKHEEVYGVLNDQDTIKSLAEMEISGVSEEGTTQIREQSRIIH